MKITQKLGLFSLLISVFIVTSCSNDFDVNGPLTEKLAVYGLMNYNDSAHYIKIYKTFVTEDNVLVAAQNMDNYMMYDSIEVLMICYDETHGTSSYHPFDTTSIVPKDSGVFSNPSAPYKQILYVNHDDISPFDSCALQIKNRYTGKLMAQSGCRLVYPRSYGTFSWANDSANPFRVASNDVSIANNNGEVYTTGPLLLRSPAINAYQYQAYYNFYYWEKASASDPEVLMGPIKINIGSEIPKDLSAQVTITWNPSSFFTVLMNQLSHLDANSPVTRRAGPIHLYVWAAGNKYSSYITNNSQSSLSIIEERPTVSNISNGIGLFSSRYLAINRNCHLSSASIGVLIDDPTYATLHFIN
jgi:hypothetical protein